MDPCTRALGMVDVLSLIFSERDNPTLAASAGVSRLWEEPALRELWRVPHEWDAVGLFRLLGPVVDGTSVWAISVSWSHIGGYLSIVQNSCFYPY